MNVQYTYCNVMICGKKIRMLDQKGIMILFSYDLRKIIFTPILSIQIVSHLQDNSCWVSFNMHAILNLEIHFVNLAFKGNIAF